MVRLHHLCLALVLKGLMAAVGIPARERVTERGYLNGDGFGLGWYPMGLGVSTHMDRVDGEPCVFTSTGPAWNNINLANIAKSIVSPVVFAHVRAATPGLRVCECW